MSELATYTFHTDPGHGWLQIEVSDLAEVGLSVGVFSKYSYYRKHMNGTTLYLEEDCDAGRYLAAFKATHGSLPSISEAYHGNQSPIRRLRRIDSRDTAWIEQGRKR